MVGQLGMLTPGVAPSGISTEPHGSCPLDISDCETPARDTVLTTHRPIMDNKDRTPLDRTTRGAATKLHITKYPDRLALTSPLSSNRITLQYTFPTSNQEKISLTLTDGHLAYLSTILVM
jgi:hypothetical protein